MKPRSPLLLVTLLALFMVPFSWSQSAGAVPKPSAAADAAKTAASAVGAKAKTAASADTLSVDFPDEDIRNILRNVADLFELNLVIPDGLQGRTSIKLRDVTWRQIFQVVLSPVGYTYVEDGNIIKVVSIESLQKEPVTTEVFVLNYARAEDIKPTLATLITSKDGKIVVDTRSNALVITETPSQINRIRPIIQDLDKATDQVMIESKFVEVTNSDVKNIGVNWASLSGMQLGVGGINQTFSRSRGQTASDSSNGNTSTTSTTTSTGQVTTSSTQTNTGTQLQPVTTTDQFGNSTTSYQVIPINSTGTTTTVTAPTSTTTTTPTSALTSLLGLTNTGATSRVASAVFSASDFNLILSALKQNNKTKLVSNPTIVTLNNTQAMINIGEEYPIPNYTYNEQRGTYEVSGFTYRPIGIILKVTPQVNSRGFIKLTLEPEVSSSNGTASFGAAQIPIITTRSAKTEVSLKDGYTMGIGGLIQDTLTGAQSSVPVLGSIPLLGRLFRSDSKDNETRNLIIFITAKTVSSDGAPIEQVFNSDAVRQLQMKRSDLPGYRDGSDPFLPETPADAKAK